MRLAVARKIEMRIGREYRTPREGGQRGQRARCLLAHDAEVRRRAARTARRPLRDILTEAARGKQPHDRLAVSDQGATPSRQLLYRVFVAAAEAATSAAASPCSWARAGKRLRDLVRHPTIRKVLLGLLSGRRVPKLASPKPAIHEHLPRIPPVSLTQAPTRRKNKRRRATPRWATGGKWRIPPKSTSCARLRGVSARARATFESSAPSATLPPLPVRLRALFRELLRIRGELI